MIRASKMELVMCLSKAVDLISPMVSDHHKQVTTVAYHLCNQLGLDEQEKKDILYAAMLHDIGILSLDERLQALDFGFEEGNRHAEKGYRLLSMYTPFSETAKIIRYHHTWWNNGNTVGIAGEDIPIGGYILHLADRVAAQIKSSKNVLGQAETITERIKEHSGGMFMPSMVDAFVSLSKKESFWLDIISGAKFAKIKREYSGDNFSEEHKLLDLMKVFSKIIDYRSRFTATHSSGVAATARAIAELYGFSESDLRKIEIAGYVHDLGKLAVDPKILEKPDKLTKEEMEIVRTHTYYTNMVLYGIKDFDTIRRWGALHHERLDGNGYPFHYDKKKLSMGSRVMAVADIFVALAEERPYREALPPEKIMTILENNVTSGAIDGRLVNLVKNNYNFIDKRRTKAQKLAELEYSSIE